LNRRELLILGSAAIAWPLATRAQQKAMPVIGYFGSTTPGLPPAAFFDGLSEIGYVEGQNVWLESRPAEGRYDRLPVLAADLVDRKVNVIVAVGGIVSAQAAKRATSTIPIIFLIGTDPVEEGLVASFARPGDNLTGITLLIAELNAKRLDLISELVPQAGVVALLVDPKSSVTERTVRDVDEAASKKGVQLVIVKASTASEIDAAFDTVVQRRAGALFVSAAPFLDTRRKQVLALAVHHTIPAIYTWRSFAESGGLVAYGASLAGVYHQLGIYAGRILKGAKPADLPVQQPTKFELVINLKTAKALGLTVPQSLLARADEVIE
jgi:ABC-type uncharacterized transport system substrate-binding protein